MKSRVLLPAMFIFGLMLLGAVASLAATNSVVTTTAAPWAIELFWVAMPNLDSCTIKSDGRVLTFESSRVMQKKKVEIVPTKEAWEAFWKAMDEVQVWKWERSYETPHVMDGLVWRLDIRRGDRKVQSTGRNAYPIISGSKKSSEQPTDPFLQYKEAVEQLIGRKLWGE